MRPPDPAKAAALPRYLRGERQSKADALRTSRTAVSEAIAALQRHDSLLSEIPDAVERLTAILDRRGALPPSDHADFYVAPSTIRGSGYGLFARRALPRGSALAFDLTPATENSVYHIQLRSGDRVGIDGLANRANEPTMLDAPNAEYVESSGPGVLLETTEAVPRDAEIFVRYGDAYDRDGYVNDLGWLREFVAREDDFDTRFGAYYVLSEWGFDLERIVRFLLEARGKHDASATEFLENLPDRLSDVRKACAAARYCE